VTGVLSSDRRKCQCRPHVILGELRVCFEHLGKGAARAQLAQDVLDRDARALDAWFAHHHGGIGGDVGVCHGSLRSTEATARMIAENTAVINAAG
jgi:hypothetical protein